MKTKQLLMFLVAILCAISMEAVEENNPVANTAAVVRSGYMRFTVLTPQMIRIQYSSTRRFEDRATFAVMNRNLPVPAYTTSSDATYFYIYTDSMTLRYKRNTVPKASDKSPVNLSITFKLNGRDVVWYPGMDKALNLKGTSRTLDSSSDDNKRTELEDGIISRAGWSVLDESPATERGDGSRTFALTKSTSGGMDWLAQPVDKSATDWYFMGYGHNYKQALGDFAKIAGRIPLPPDYIFGYWYSRYYRYSAEDFKTIVNDVERYDIPMDVMIFDKDWHIDGWTGWSWNKDLIPDPKGLIDWMHNHGLRVSLNLHPADGVNSNEDNFNLMCNDLGLNPSTTTNIPWQLYDSTFYKSFSKNILRLRESEGVDFWWLDWQQWLLDKYVDGLGATFWCNHVFFEDMRLNRPDRRPVIFHRWGGMGSHRYQIGFSGDSWASFPTLGYQPYFTSTASNVGFGYWGHDLGGHNQWGANDSELYLRWIQYGVFTPIFRTHATETSTIERRIWKYPNFLLMREAVRLRYKLFPYIYTAAREAYDTGISICRPLYYDYPEDAKAYSYENEYMFGNDIFVSPIVTRSGSDGSTKHTVWLPEGLWWNVTRSTLMEGNSTFIDNYAQREIPYFYKAGSVIVNYPVQRHVTTRPDSIILKVVPGASGESSFYEDEGDTEGYKDSLFTRTKLTQERSETGVTLHIAARTGSFAGMPDARKYCVDFLGQESPEDVLINGKSVTTWTYDAGTKTISVSVPSTPCSDAIAIEVKSTEIAKTPATAEETVDYTGGVEIVPETTTKLWIVGSAVEGGVQELTSFPNQQFKFAGTLHEGEFKIMNTQEATLLTTYLKPEVEGANIVNNGLTFAYSTNSADPAWQVSYTDATYQFTVDLSGKTVTGSRCIPWSQFYIVGGCASCGWDVGEALPFTCDETNPYLWTWTGVLKNRPEFVEPKRFKLTGQGDWDPKHVHPYTQDENVTTSTKLKVGGDDNKWSIGADGFYRITLNLLTEAFDAEYLGTETGISPVELTDNVQITSAYQTILVRSTENVKVQIYDVSGKALASDTGTDVSINMSKAGVYTVHVTGTNVKTSKKILLR